MNLQAAIDWIVTSAKRPERPRTALCERCGRLPAQYPCTCEAAYCASCWPTVIGEQAHA